MAQTGLIGYLDIKQPRMVKGSKFKVWKTKWIEVHQMSDISAETYSAKLYVFADEGTSKTKRNDKYTIFLENVKRIAHLRSRTRQYALEIITETGPVLNLAGNSESQRQTWIKKLRQMLWPSTLLSLTQDEFEVSVIDNASSEKLGLNGEYRLTVTPDKLTLRSFIISTDIAIQWKLSNLKRFCLTTNQEPDNNRIFIIFAGRNSDTGEGDYKLFSFEAPSLLALIRRCIDKAIRPRGANTIPTVGSTASFTSIGSFSSHDRTSSDTSEVDGTTPEDIICYDTIGLAPIVEDGRSKVRDSLISNDSNYNTLDYNLNGILKRVSPRTSPDTTPIQHKKIHTLTKDNVSEDKKCEEIEVKEEREPSSKPEIKPRNKPDKPIPRPRPRIVHPSAFIANQTKINRPPSDNLPDDLYDVVPNCIRTFVPPPLPIRRINHRGDGYSDVRFLMDNRAGKDDITVDKDIPEGKRSLSSSSQQSSASVCSRDSGFTSTNLLSELEKVATTDSTGTGTTNDGIRAELKHDAITSIQEEEKGRKVSTGSNIYQEIYQPLDSSSENNHVDDEKTDLIVGNSEKRRLSLKDFRRGSLEAISKKLSLSIGNENFEQIPPDDDSDNLYEDIDRYTCTKNIVKYHGKDETPATPPPTPERPPRRIGLIENHPDKKHSIDGIEKPNKPQLDTNKDSEQLTQDKINDIFTRPKQDRKWQDDSDDIKIVRKDITSYLGIEEGATIVVEQGKEKPRSASRPKNIFSTKPISKRKRIKQKLNKLVKGHKNSRSEYSSSDEDNRSMASTPVKESLDSHIGKGEEVSNLLPSPSLNLKGAKYASQSNTTPNVSDKRKQFAFNGRKSKHTFLNDSGNSSLVSSTEKVDSVDSKSADDLDFNAASKPVDPFFNLINFNGFKETPVERNLSSNSDLLSGGDISSAPVMSPTVVNLRHGSSSNFEDISIPVLSSPSNDLEDPFSLSSRHTPASTNTSQSVFTFDANNDIYSHAYSFHADESSARITDEKPNEAAMDKKTSDWIAISEFEKCLSIESSNGASELQAFLDILNSSNIEKNSSIRGVCNNMYFDMTKSNSEDKEYTDMRGEHDLYVIPRKP